jgi:hypothetical protein
MGRLIVLEFNELTPSLVTRFMQAGQLPSFSKLFSESHTFISDAEEHAPNLEPWIQWVTVQTGLSFAEHGVFDLGDGHKLTAPRVWDLASDVGRKVWVCGSMNAGRRGPVKGYILPDPWSVGFEPYPAREFDAYFKFVSSHVQEYTRDQVPLSRADQLDFMRFMARRGLSMRTVSTILLQLARERSGRNRWKRATILDRLQWDLFRWYYRDFQPDYATFFLNSTAHFQHFYWRNMDPESFVAKPSRDDQAEHGEAILYGYQQMDQLIKECLELAGVDVTVMLCTGLSQQPCLTYEGTGGKKEYRMNDPDALLRFVGVTEPYRYEPVMAEQFWLRFNSDAAAADAERRLAGLSIGDKPAMFTKLQSSEVFGGCSAITELPEGTVLTSCANGASSSFYDLFYRVDATKSGMHHPDGIWWIRTPQRKHQEHGRVSLRQVAPTILSILGVPLPDSMKLPPVAAIHPHPVLRPEPVRSS